MKNTTKLLALASVALLSSCEKVIDIDLGNTDPVLVIEAIVQDGESFVNISRTRSFDDATLDSYVVGAMVDVVDQSGTVFSFTEANQGQFVHSTLSPTPGTFYTLNVNLAGETYTAMSQMPTTVALDTMIFEELNQPFVDTVEYSLELMYEDPAGEDNFYQFRFATNDVVERGFFTADDLFNDGLFTTYPLWPNTFIENDTVMAELVCITEDAFDYLVVLEGNTEDAGLFAGAPADPDPFFGRTDVLGYFSVQSVSSRVKVLVP